MIVYFQRGDSLVLTPKAKEAERRYMVVYCRNRQCTNEARYSSGYCGLCDIAFNDGKGERQR